MDPTTVGWTDEIVGALPEWLRAELGLEAAPEAPIVPPPNLPGYAPLPGLGGGYAPPVEVKPPATGPSSPPSYVPAGCAWASLAVGALVGAAAVWIATAKR